jgi:hypothetical protein
MPLPSTSERVQNETPRRFRVLLADDSEVVIRGKLSGTMTPRINGIAPEFEAKTIQGPIGFREVVAAPVRNSVEPYADSPYLSATEPDLPVKIEPGQDEFALVAGRAR